MPVATYVYCLIAAPRKPALGRVPSGLPAMGPVRLLETDDAPRDLRTWLVVADAPQQQYGEDAINRRLSDLEWVARAAVAHEAVVESFIAAPAVLPMKLFTIFSSDARAVEHIARDRRRIEGLLRRVTNQQEWGVRVRLDRARALADTKPSVTTGRVGRSGSGYLAHKKAQRDAAGELAERARDTVATLYDRLEGVAGASKRRSAGELPIEGGPLLLDGAFLVPRSQSTRFRALVGREARALDRRGYEVSLTGPWPPYSFIQD